MNESTGRAGYQFEFEDRVDCVFIGAGGHAYRNVYPALQYAPVNLRAVCDLDAERAETYARMFGAASSGTDYRRVLEREKPAAAFIVTGYDGKTGRVQATDIAKECLDAGVNVWMEKPTAASAGEVRELMAASERSGCVVVTGLKKIFAPAMEKLGSVVGAPEFGGLSSLTVRYPQALPPFDQRADLRAMRGFLDHLYHP
ncbi:MAG: Gfo/Idh/MocA family protein, partial [Nocardioidaceae bacterium]